MKILFVLLLIPHLALAQLPAPVEPPFATETLAHPLPGEIPPEESPIEEVVKEAEKIEVPSEKKKKVRKKSKRQRDHSTGTVMLGYQLIGSWVPSKLTGSYTHIFNDKWSLEGEFAYSKLGDPIPWIDLGSIIERRYTLQARRYVGNSFHFLFGAVLSEFTAALDASSVGQGFSSDFSAQNLGVTGGIGNRWQFSNGITFGIDWLRLNIPVAEIKVEDNVLDDLGAGEQDDVKKTIRRFNRIPTFVLFGLNIGYTF